MMSLITKGLELMPPDLVSSNKPRAKMFSIRQNWPYLVKQQGFENDLQGPLVVGFTIQNNKRPITLLGLQVEIMMGSPNEVFSFEVKNAAGKCVGKGSSSGYKIIPECRLDAGSKHTLLLTLHRADGWNLHLDWFNVQQDGSLTFDGTSRTIVSKWSCLRDNVVRDFSLLFSCSKKCCLI